MSDIDGSGVVVPFPARDTDEVADRCACGAPAALSVGYRGESAPVLQCVRRARNDRRTPFAHRELGWGVL